MRDDMGKAFADVVKRRARRGVVMLIIEDMMCACGVRDLRPAKHENALELVVGRGLALARLP